LRSEKNIWVTRRRRKSAYEPSLSLVVGGVPLDVVLEVEFSRWSLRVLSVLVAPGSFQCRRVCWLTARGDSTVGIKNKKLATRYRRN